jgi:hypothetical protein
VSLEAPIGVGMCYRVTEMIISLTPVITVSRPRCRRRQSPPHLEAMREPAKGQFPPIGSLAADRVDAGEGTFRATGTARENSSEGRGRCDRLAEKKGVTLR